MGIFDVFRKKSPSSAAAVTSGPPAAPTSYLPAGVAWQPTPSLVAAMREAAETVGNPNDAGVMASHAAVDEALRAVYGAQEPLGWSRQPVNTLVHARVYRGLGPGGPYFHYLTWGLSEVGAKVNGNPEVSGFGIELSMKLAARPDEVAHNPQRPGDGAPEWPLELLDRLATAVFRSRRPFSDGDWIEANGLFGPERIGHLGCAFDASVPVVSTPTGRFHYLQVFALTDLELAQCKAQGGHAHNPVIDARRNADPDLVVQRGP